MVKKKYIYKKRQKGSDRAPTCEDGNGSWLLRHHVILCGFIVFGVA